MFDMSYFSDMSSDDRDDPIWKALGDGRRREMLDALAGEGPLTTGDLVLRFPGLCRTAVMRHLDVLVDVGLVAVRREGRMRWNYLNPVPIQAVCDRWVSAHVRHLASALHRLRDVAEGNAGRRTR